MNINKHMNNLLEAIPKVLLQLWTENKEYKELKISKEYYRKLRDRNELYDYLYANGIDIGPGKMFKTRENINNITFTQEVNLNIKPHPNFIFFDDYNEAAHRFGPDAVHVKSRNFKADFSLISKNNFISHIKDFCNSVINDLVKNNFVRGQKLDIRIYQLEWGDMVDLRIRQIYVYKNNDLDVDKYKYIPKIPEIPQLPYESLSKEMLEKLRKKLEMDSAPFTPPKGEQKKSIAEMLKKELEQSQPKQIEDTTPRYLTEPIVISETIKAYDQSES